MLDAPQIRAARALLNWSREDLAQASGLSVPALARVELGDAQARPTTMDRIKATFEGAGVVFTEGSGVRLRTEIVQIYKGTSALETLFNEIYTFASKEGTKAELLCSGFSGEQLFNNLSKEFIQLHSERMSELGGIYFKTLISEDEEDNYYSVKYSEYRKLPKDFFLGVPFYVYGNHLAIITLSPLVQVILIDEKNIAEVYRQQFKVLWEQAKPLSKKGKASA